MTVLALAAGFLALGLILRLPGRVLAAGLAALWLAALLASALLPEGGALRAAAGGDWRAWAAAGLVAGVVVLYRAGLGRLKARARPVPPAAKAPAPFSATELDRYARHIVLREVGGQGQKRLKAARVLVVGAGGLGSPALLYLAAAGVGTIGVIDDDDVSNSNLQRQIIHTDTRIGQPKVASAAVAMQALNPFVTVDTWQERLDEGRAAALFPAYDLILDGSDNFDTRYLVNRAAVAAGKPLVAAAITQWEGQIGLYHPAGGGPCYECLFPERPEPGLAPSCAEAGVIAPLPGVVGSMMALEAVKHLTGAGETLKGRLLIYDGLWGETRIIAAARRPGCAACGGPHAGGVLDSAGDGA
ncbi:MAG: molybdopterin-synthase adenylyltransferase MoeB [Proteobacteria bacterium]|nr:molybdopterin-synthase adenylyltransferase MoeB [Pseudomonadota bacterium]MBS0572649.1 molybdopterin-synthase adenylyltransferase MoeB [Pseudomonadota bacterium]